VSTQDGTLAEAWAAGKVTHLRLQPIELGMARSPLSRQQRVDEDPLAQSLQRQDLPKDERLR
jgi:hypothetical protein